MTAKDERPSFVQLYMDLAHGMARRSTCARLQVGCAIVSADFRYVFGVGYNGAAAGLRNHCARTEPGNCGCLHAECNAIINCVAPRSEPKIVLSTHLPCEACAQMIINLGGVTRVIYATDYRVKTGLTMLDWASIQTMHRPQVTP